MSQRTEPGRPELAAYAVIDALTRGRQHAEPAAYPRGEFQRDRDRIVHSTAFRRLEYKTPRSSLTTKAITIARA